VHDEIHTIILKDKEIARFRYSRRDWDERDRPSYTLTLFDTAERDILDMVGLGDADYKSYVSRKRECRACLRLARAHSGPEMDVVAVRL
jgi:hypothetical protein